MQPKLLLLLVVTVMLGNTVAHNLGIGSCRRKLPVVEKMDLDKFAGKWHVMEVVKAYSKCLTMTFTKTDERNLKVTEAREFAFLEPARLQHTNKYTGALSIPDPREPATMNIKWPLNFAQASFHVIDTDYTNYALVYECQQWLFATRTTAAILARGKTLDTETLDKLRAQLPKLDISPGDMTPIDQQDCLAEGEGVFNTNIDRETFEGDGNIFDFVPEAELANIKTQQQLADRLMIKFPEQFPEKNATDQKTE